MMNDETIDHDAEGSDPLRTRLSRRGFLQVGGGLTGGLIVASPALFRPGLAAATTTWAGLDSNVASQSVSAVTSLADVTSTGGPLLTGDTFPIGIFWPPPPLQTTVARYKQIVNAGFTFMNANNYLYADTEIASYALAIAEQVGLQVLVNDPDIQWLVNSFDITDTGGDFTLTVAEATTVIQNVINRYQLQSPWSIQNGQLFINGGSGNGSVGLSKAGGPSWTDYTFAFDTVTLETGAGGSYGQSGWAFRAQDVNNCYIWILGNNSTTPGYLTKAIFVSGAPSVTTVTLPFPVTAGVSYHVETTVVGSTITTSVNGQVVDTTTDSTYLDGNVGFREAGTESCRFDNVTITDTSGKVLLSDDFSDGLVQWNPPTNGGYTSFAGLSLFDEPPASKYATLANAVSIVESLAPDILPFINMLPDTSGGTFYSDALAAMKPLQLSFDRYPFLASGLDLGYFQNWAEVRSAALAAGVPAWAYIQSVGFAGTVVPNAADLLWQINVSLAYGCKGIQYFTYWTPDPARGQDFTGALLSVEGEPGPLYAAAKEINNNYLTPIGKQLLPLTSVSVESANLASPPAGLPAFTSDSYVASTTGSPVVMGQFEVAGSANSTRWILVVNYSPQDVASVTITFGDAVTAVEKYNPSSEEYITAPTLNLGKIQLAAGGALLLRLNG
jgi:hypothetical protein